MSTPKPHTPIIRSLYISTMLAMILNYVVQSVNQFIDGMLTSRFLGADAISSFGLFSPLGMCVSAVSCVLWLGTQVECSHLMGKGESDKAKAVFRSSLTVLLVLSCALMAAFLIAAEPIAELLGAKDTAAHLKPGTVMYLRGYAIGVPGYFLFNMLLSLLQLTGKRRRAFAATMVILAVNIAGDLAVVFFLGHDLLGMALATSVSNYAALLVALPCFLKPKDSPFRPIPGRVRPAHVRGVLKNGAPPLFYFVSSTLRTMFINYLILVTIPDGWIVLAVVSVLGTFLSLTASASGGVGDGVLLIAGVLYGEEDRRGMRTLLKSALTYGLGLVTVLCLVCFLLAHPLALLFGGADAALTEQMAHAIRLVAFSNALDCILCVLNKYRQALGQSLFVGIMNILSGFLFVCLSAIVLRSLIGTDGIYLAYSVTYVFAIGIHVVLAALRKRSLKLGLDDFLLLPDDFGAKPEDTMEADIRTMDDVMAVSAAAVDFCTAHGMDSTGATRLSLAVEEMGGNIVTHGFSDGKKHLASLLIRFKDGDVILRLRDDCRAFDPTEYYRTVDQNTDPETALGIRAVVGLAKDVKYVNSLSLNNLFIRI